MILSLGQGEPSYVPDGLMGQGRDYADVSFLAFLQCYARDLVKWEIICYFAAHQDEWHTWEMVAASTGRPADEIAANVGELAERHLLEEQVLSIGPLYRLTHSPHLRHQVARLGCEWRCLAE